MVTCSQGLANLRNLLSGLEALQSIFYGLVTPNVMRLDQILLGLESTFK